MKRRKAWLLFGGGAAVSVAAIITALTMNVSGASAARVASQSDVAVASPEGRAALPGNVTVQLYRISGKLATPGSDEWGVSHWNLRGEPLPDPYRNNSAARRTIHDGERLFVASVRYPQPNQEVSVNWNTAMPERMRRGWGNGYNRDGKNLSLATHFGTMFEPEERHVSLRFGVAYEAWETVAAAAPGQTMSGEVPGAGTVTLTAPPPTEKVPDGDGGTLRRGSHPVLDMAPATMEGLRPYEYRLVGVDDAGKPVLRTQPTRERMDNGDLASHIIFSTWPPEIRLHPEWQGRAADVREYRFQVRRWRWVEFKDVPLYPAAVASDTPTK